MSKFFKNHKRDFIMWGLVLLIFGLIFLIVYYENKDKKHYHNIACNNDINIVDDEINLNSNYYIDENGNIVSQNLIDPSNFNNYNQSFSYSNNIFTFTSNSGFNNYTNLILSNYESLKGQSITFSVGNVQNVGGAEFRVGIYNGTDLLLPQVVTSNWSYTFDVPNDSTSLIFVCYTNWINSSSYGTSIVSNIMCNVGSSALPYEPFGTWFKNEGESYSVLYNIFNNSVGKLYRVDNDVLVFSENIVLSASDVSISMYNFPNIFNYLNGYDSEDTSTYPTQYFYFTLELSTSTNSPLVFSLNNAILDTEISLLYNNQNLSVFTRGTDRYHIFVNQDSIYTYNEIYYSEFYAPDYVSLDFNISTSGILYNKGYSDGVDFLKYDYQDLQNRYNSLESQYVILDSNYLSLLEQYNALNSDEYSFSELIWSIGSVPFAVLTSGFNVNVMGISLASIITGLFTSMLLIWIIKKFFR